MKKRCLFPGSFDPFTNGHLHIVRQSLELFDEVVIVIAHNPSKKSYMSDTDKKYAILEAIQKELSERKDDIYVIVNNSDLIPSKMAEKYGCSHIVRGIRNNMDYQYEEALATLNDEFNPNIKTIYIRTENSAISSTMVKTFLHSDVDISKYIPFDKKWILTKDYYIFNDKEMRKILDDNNSRIKTNIERQ